VPETAVTSPEAASFVESYFQSQERQVSSLDQQESNVTEGGSTGFTSPAELHNSLETSFRHSGWQHPRARIFSALQDIDVSENRVAAFQACGTSAWIVRHPDHPDRLAVRSLHCHDRFCVPCAREKGWRIGQNVMAYTVAKRIRFVTLTIRHSDLPLSDQLDFLIKSFRALRHTPFWKSRVTGGVSFLEVKSSEDGRFWHPHIHVLAEGQYIEQKILSHTWHTITRTSFIVDVREPRGRDDVVHYVTKYAAKPLGMGLTLLPERLREALTEMKSRRLMTTFGSWRGFLLCAKPDQIDWIVVAPLADIMLRMSAGEPWAISIYSKLKGSRSCQPKRQPRKRRPRPPPESDSALSLFPQLIAPCVATA